MNGAGSAIRITVILLQSFIEFYS